MIDINPNFAAVRQGLIPLTNQEKLKLEKDALEVIDELGNFARDGFASIPEDDFERLKWFGIYRQKPKDSGFFMLRLKVPGGERMGTFIFFGLISY